MTVEKKTPAELRSARWFAPDDLRAFGHRSRAMQMGYAPEDWVGRPVIAILNTCRRGASRWSCRRCRCRKAS